MNRYDDEIIENNLNSGSDEPISKTHLLIYDRSNNDSLFCAALQKYAMIHNYGIDENIITALNWDEIPYTTNTSVQTIKNKHLSITLCATIIELGVIRIMYTALHDSFLSIQFNHLYRDKIRSLNVCITQLYQEREKYSQLAKDSILNIGQSATLTLYKHLSKYFPEYITHIPNFYQYLDGFVTDSYYEYDLDRDDVIAFNKGLSKLYSNDFTKVYKYFSENGPGIEDVDRILNEGSKKITTMETYILNTYKRYGGEIWKANEKGLITRKVLPLFTDERLTTSILKDELFNNYDSVVTFNRLKTGNWEMRFYNILHIDPIEDFNNLTIEQERNIVKNTFSAGVYIKEKYNGTGNDIYGYAILTDNQFGKILRFQTV